MCIRDSAWTERWHCGIASWRDLPIERDFGQRCAPSFREGFIRPFCRQLGARFADGEDLCDVLSSLIQMIVPTLFPHELLNILSLRTCKDDVEVARMMSSEVAEVFNKNDSSG
eukprot:4819885-Lingulodinium_polyedra.AAC.1